MERNSMSAASASEYQKICVAISTVVEEKRRKLTTNHNLTHDDVDDLRQEACLRAGTRRFPRLASPDDYQSVALVVVKQALIDKRRYSLAIKRDVRCTVSLETLDEPPCAQASLYPHRCDDRKNIELTDLRIDATALRSSLQPPAREVADLVAEHSISYAAKTLRLPRETLRDHVKRLRNRFLPLSIYLEK